MRAWREEHAHLGLTSDGRRILDDLFDGDDPTRSEPAAVHVAERAGAEPFSERQRFGVQWVEDLLHFGRSLAPPPSPSGQRSLLLGRPFGDGREAFG